VTVAAASRTSSRPGGGARAPLVVGACLAVALASLAVPSTLGYDPWAWLVWGREVGRWSLDTTGGPSWKPLPVAATTLLAPLGDLAVPAYAVLARTAALLAVVAVARLAARLGGPVAATVAAVLLVLTPDGDPRFVRLVLEGHEAPWSMGLALAALLAVVDRRPGLALAWTWLLALLRPEAWPFLLALVLWQLGARRPAGRLPTPVRLALGVPAGGDRSGPPGGSPAVARGSEGTPSTWAGLPALASIPVLWFVPDWVGAGSPAYGAGHAQVLADQSVLTRLGDSLGTAAGMVPVPVWVLAALAVLAARRRGDAVPVALALAALAWTGLVVGMAAALGYAALSRFSLPAAAVACVLAATAVEPLVAWLRARSRPVVAAVLAVALLLVAPRVLGVVDVVEEVADRGRLEDELQGAIDAAGGAEAISRCRAAVVAGRTLLRSAAAWTLDLRLDEVERAAPGRPAVLLLTDGAAIASARSSASAVELARVGRWTAFADRCEVGVR